VSQRLSRAISELLRPEFPFTRLLEEAPIINQRLGLSGETAFDQSLKPVFFVGDISADPRFLLVGLKPGKGSDSNSRFTAERTSLATTDFDAYFDSRLNYFSSPAFNGTHYGPIAKLAGSLAESGFPLSAAAALHATAVQVEMFPLFAASQGFDLGGLRWLREETISGRLATQVLETVVAHFSGEFVIARYRTTFALICELFNGRLGESIGIFPTATISVGGRHLRLVCLPGDRGITNAHLALQDNATPRRASPRSATSRNGALHREFEELRARIGAIDAAIGEKARAGGSLAFDYPYRGGRRNFVCITPRPSGTKLDALRSNLQFEDGIKFRSVDSAVGRCKEALDFLRGGPTPAAGR
jgi:hypothetical protein